MQSPVNLSFRCTKHPFCFHFVDNSELASETFRRRSETGHNRTTIISVYGAVPISAKWVQSRRTTQLQGVDPDWRLHSGDVAYLCPMHSIGRLLAIFVQQKRAVSREVQVENIRLLQLANESVIAETQGDMRSLAHGESGSRGARCDGIAKSCGTKRSTAEVIIRRPTVSTSSSRQQGRIARTAVRTSLSCSFDRNTM